MEHKDPVKEQLSDAEQNARMTENEQVLFTVEEEQQNASEEGGEEETEGQQQPGGGKKRKRGARGGSHHKTTNEPKNEELEEQLDKTQAELSEMKDKYLRLYAEFDNYRKRTGKEKLELIKTASQDVLAALLPVLDDFERAMKAAETSGETFPEGIILIYEKLFRTAEQQGLKPMESTGQPFDADSHEAITKIPAPLPELKGKVVDTVEKGYYLNDKIIRYAKVVVGE